MTDTEISPLPGLDGAPPTIADLAAATVQYVERAVGIAVDFTPETLPIVDHYASLVRNEVVERPEVLPLVARGLGAYFGQVAVRQLGGFWHVPSDDDHRWYVCLRPVLLAFNPVGIAYDVLLQGARSSGPSCQVFLAREERELVHARLDSLPQVGEEEYFMLATRLEGLEIAAAALADRAEAATADVQFDWEDYRDIVPTEMA